MRQQERETCVMANNNKKLVEAITPMSEDLAQWYTDVVKKAELIEYSSVRGCMIICQCSFQKVYCKEKKIT